MAAKKGGAKPGAASKGKEKKKKPSNKVGNAYDTTGGELKRKNRSCPKCGAGTFMGNHKDRWSCGKCGFMEKK